MLLVYIQQEYLKTVHHFQDPKLQIKHVIPSKVHVTLMLLLLTFRNENLYL